MDLSGISTAELRELQVKIPKEIERRSKDEKAKLLKDMEAMAKERGYSLDELVGSESAAKKPRQTVAPKYCNPQSPEITWSGRGIQPKWVKAHLENGGSLEQLKIA